MRNPLRILWRDLMDLSRGDFAMKYLFPLPTVVLTYAAIGSFCMAALDENDLEKQTGRISAIQIEPETKKSKGSLFISLDNFGKWFRLTSDYSTHFDWIQARIKVNDHITIYHRNDFLTYVGMGKEYDIFQITKEDKPVFSIDRTKEKKVYLGGLTTFFSLALWSVYLLAYNARRKKGSEIKIQS